MDSAKPWTLTNHLLSLDPDQYTRATQSPFLHRAAHGRISKRVLSEWLANDRLYIHAYIKGVGAFLRDLYLPPASQSPSTPEVAETKVLDWLIEALANVRKEERFFNDVAQKYDLSLSLPKENGRVVKLEGLKHFERIFGAVSSDVEAAELAWLEGAVVFWATEKCYLQAWSWAKEQMPDPSEFKDVAADEDGGALRKEFIPNWSSSEFREFVNQMAQIIDQGVEKALQSPSRSDQVDYLRKEVEIRAEELWKEVLTAEIAFWPDVDDI